MQYRLRTPMIVLALGPRVLVFVLVCSILGCTRKDDAPTTKSTLEMSKQDRERWHESERPRFGDPKDYLPPNTVETMPCDYTQGDKHDIVIFAAKGKLDEIGQWYTQKLPIHVYEKHD